LRKNPTTGVGISQVRPNSRLIGDLFAMAT